MRSLETMMPCLANALPVIRLQRHCNIHFMFFLHSSNPHISLFARAWCHFFRITLLVCLHKAACNVYQAVAQYTSTSYVSLKKKKPLSPAPVKEEGCYDKVS